MNETLANNIGETASGLAEFQGGKEKLEIVMPKLQAMNGSEVRQFNLSVPATTSASIRIWQSYLADKAQFLSTFTPKGFDAEGIEDFPLRTAALWYADVQLGQAINPSGGMPQEIISRAKPMHQKLAKAALYLWSDHETLGPVVADIRQGAGHLDMAGDLTRYAVLFQENWSAAEGNCEVTPSDLNEAKQLSTLMLEALTAAPEGTVSELKDLRARAGEYLRRGADQIRTAAEYIFRDDPTALSRYPSLHQIKYPSRSRSRPASEEPAPQTDDTAVEA